VNASTRSRELFEFAAFFISVSPARRAGVAGVWHLLVPGARQADGNDCCCGARRCPTPDSLGIGVRHRLHPRTVIIGAGSCLRRGRLAGCEACRRCGFWSRPRLFLSDKGLKCDREGDRVIRSRHRHLIAGTRRRPTKGPAAFGQPLPAAQDCVMASRRRHDGMKRCCCRMFALRRTFDSLQWRHPDSAGTP